MDTAVNWVSDNAMVATVSENGVVTARMNGQAIIVAVSSNLTARATVIVMQTAASIVIKTEPPLLDAIGQTFQMQAAVYDANDSLIADIPVNWTSSDTTVVSIDGKGLVTTQGNGTANVTAASGEASASTVVTVSQVPVRAVVTPDFTILRSVDETLQLEATALDRNDFPVSGIEFSWTSSDPEVAVIGSSGQVTARLNGTTRITAVSDQFTVYSEIEVRINSPHLASLAALYQFTTGPDWINSAYWLSDALVHEWHGVTADRMSLVTEIDLTNNYLQRTLPAEVAEIGSLRILVLSDNPFLSGPLQKAMTRLDLDVLHLDGTNMCVPADADFQDWLRGIPDVRATTCDRKRRDWDALVALYNATNGPNWFKNDNWLTNAPLDSWFGVEADEIGKVRLIRLDDNNLDGEIPAEIAQLDGLDWLSMDNNQLTGSLPPELGQMSKLRVFWVTENNLSGPVPAEIGDMVGLTSLHMAHNQLTGSIPPELGNLHRLINLVLSTNLLTGSIPPELAQITGLELLLLSNNSLSGSIPPELGRLTKARGINLGYNQLTGEIPPELGRIETLEVINYPNNMLSGSIPAELAFARKVRWVELKDNPDLKGPLPRSFLYLNLEGLQLQGTGVCIPSDDEFMAWLSGIMYVDAVHCENTAGRR